ncbi:MAG: polyprenol monophosphomannose synthase, partial [Gammaproteobacteria bacterium]
MMNPNKTVVIIIPTYNEQESIEKTILDLQAVIKTLISYEVTILVFDSASTDETQNKVKKYQNCYQNIILLSEQQKTGLGSAYIKAMKYVINELKADIIFQFDADGSHQPKYLPGMLKILENGSDVVVGSRYIPGGSIPKDWALYRKLLSTFGNIIIRHFLTKKYTDYTSGYRGIKVPKLRQIDFDKLLSHNYPFLLNLTWLLHQAGAIIKEFPIEFIDREKGSSKLPINNILETIKVIISLRFYEIVKKRGKSELSRVKT